MQGNPLPGGQAEGLGGLGGCWGHGGDISTPLPGSLLLAFACPRDEREGTKKEKRVEPDQGDAGSFPACLYGIAASCLSFPFSCSVPAAEPGLKHPRQRGCCGVQQGCLHGGHAALLPLFWTKYLGRLGTVRDLLGVPNTWGDGEGGDW